MNSYEIIKNKLQALAGEGVIFSCDQPEDSAHGDYSTNIAFALSKKKGVSPQQCAEECILVLREKLGDVVEKIEVAGVGFINFYLKDDVRTDGVEEIAAHGILRPLRDEKIIIEYTDPNPFKLFHIGHIVPNAIGESLARIYESKGYEVTRICYQGDKGMHVAKTIFGMQWFEKNIADDRDLYQEFFDDATTLTMKVSILGMAYTVGNSLFENAQTDEEKNIFKELNKTIYQNDPSVHSLYTRGKQVSLDYFETLYKKLGTQFDYYIFESEVADRGARIVRENLGTVFEESDGAIVYIGEKVGLHTRVFINSEGLPTYEAKELGNTYKKVALIPGAAQSLVVTAHEIDEYFKVIKAALTEIDKPLADKLVHISHGMLRLPEGKMSSRKGNIIPAEELINQVCDHLRTRLDNMKVSNEDKEQLLNDIAVGAIKFAILKSAPGKDMIFDFEKSISFEGDSGPYLQYTHARLCALLDKAKVQEISFEHGYVVSAPERELEKTLIGYHEVLEKAYQGLAPQHIVQYLLLLTRVFNNLYSRIQIVDENDKDKSSYYVMLATATKSILAYGLNLLGIKAPERM